MEKSNQCGHTYFDLLSGLRPAVLMCLGGRELCEEPLIQSARTNGGKLFIRARLEIAGKMEGLISFQFFTSKTWQNSSAVCCMD